MIKKTFITEKRKETQNLGKILAGEIKKGAIICLSGDLGAGKTTFTQGLLKGLEIKGPYISPTFLIIKNYKRKFRNAYSMSKNKKQIHDTRSTVQDIYHIDAYRVNQKDILNLGWKELIAEKDNIIIIEWAERIRKIIPKNAVWIKFEWVGENKRKLTFK